MLGLKRKFPDRVLGAFTKHIQCLCWAWLSGKGNATKTNDLRSLPSSPSCRKHRPRNKHYNTARTLQWFCSHNCNKNTEKGNSSLFKGHSAHILRGPGFLDKDYYVITFLNFIIAIFKETHSTKMEGAISDSWHSWKVLAQENFNGPVINRPKWELVIEILTDLSLWQHYGALYNKVLVFSVQIITCKIKSLQRILFESACPNQWGEVSHKERKCKVHCLKKQGFTSWSSGGPGTRGFRQWMMILTPPVCIKGWSSVWRSAAFHKTCCLFEQAINLMIDRPYD